MLDHAKSIGWVGAAAFSLLASSCATTPQDSSASISATKTTIGNARAQAPGREFAARTRGSLIQKRSVYYKIVRPSDPTIHTVGLPNQPVLPPFPTSWPPPAPTTFYSYPPSTLDHYRTLGDVAAALQSSARMSGRTDMTFYRCPGGFALILPREQIDKLGYRTIEPAEKYTFAKSLYKHRLMGFFISDQIGRDPDKGLTFERAGSWMRNGSAALDHQTAILPLTREHKLFAFLYIYFGSRGDEVLQSEDDLKPETHLFRSKMMFPPPAIAAKRKTDKASLGDSPK